VAVVIVAKAIEILFYPLKNYIFVINSPEGEKE